LHEAGAHNVVDRLAGGVGNQMDVERVRHSIHRGKGKPG
jgi:hypothetical protein